MFADVMLCVVTFCIVAVALCIFSDEIEKWRNGIH